MACKIIYLVMVLCVWIRREYNKIIIIACMIIFKCNINKELNELCVVLFWLWKLKILLGWTGVLH